MLSLKVQIPFWICTLIWGTTWIVILGQLGTVPPSWSVTYRFLTAGIAMFAYALFTKAPLRIGREGQIFAIIFGIAQFVFNFNFVYRAEAYVTSGLVAVIFALLIVPNTLFARLFLGIKPTPRFYAGAAIAMAGIGLLFLKEYREAAKGSDAVLLGIGITMLGVLSASVANIMQATKRAATLPIASLLAWGMFWGTLFDALLAWATVGPPVIEPSFSYLGGVVYLGVAASAIAFMAYFSVIRMIGPGPAAYSSVIVPVIAMGISTVFEGYRWTLLAGAGGALAMAGLVIALTARKPST
ncbi:MAG: DMT family transporter [Pseudomonadota bacterium]